MQKLTRIMVAAALVSIASLSSAEPLPFPPPPALNKISYQVTVEKWATTETALVTVSMDAALDKVGLSTVNSHVLDNLNKMASKADWHITQFTRSQDKSGLEMLHVEAQARLSQDSMAALRDKAKEVSKPGETYTVTDIDFSPSVAEMEKTHADARAVIYDNVKQEIARLNQVYPDQHYFLNALDFMAQPPVQPVMYKGMAMATSMPAPNQEGQPSMPVNAKVSESAQVVIAARVVGDKD